MPHIYGKMDTRLSERLSSLLKYFVKIETKDGKVLIRQKDLDEFKICGISWESILLMQCVQELEDQKTCADIIFGGGDYTSAKPQTNSICLFSKEVKKGKKSVKQKFNERTKSQRYIHLFFKKEKSARSVTKFRINEKQFKQ